MTIRPVLSAIVLAVSLTACSGVEDTNDTDPGTDTDTELDSEQDTDEDTEQDTDVDGAVDVLLTALVAKNDLGDTDEAGDADDWLEITNEGALAVDLSDWGLTDGYPDETPWRFPADTQLASGATLRVWADEDPDDGPFHADFKLSGDGETLTLLNANDDIMDEVTFPALEDDEVYARQDDGSWAIAE